MDPAILLQKNHLSRTRNRMNILKVLMDAHTPLSGKEICEMMLEKCDKSTVHRTLNSLFHKKLVLRVIVDHEFKYALKSKHDKSGSHGSDHIHFMCSRCERLFCLTELEVQDYELPEGFIKEENQFLVIGICKACH